ncbi:hypothetical protein SAY87_025083 [Trapa incisa]|uniref:SLH domain-containing protein n=1 Tax=Trapa incisa TaxID=236973 RepID=A0AAN7GFB9_9MYRT|nr:hypothetical protein SAY87_025083 [Trapa incisa]
MTSSTAFPVPSFFLPSGVRRHGVTMFLGQRSSLLSTVRVSRPGLLHASASLAERGPALSWYASDSSSEFNGWAFKEVALVRDIRRRGSPTFVIAGIGASLAVLIGLTTQFSLSRQGFKFHFCSPLSVLQGLSQRTESLHELDEIAGSGGSNGITFSESSEMESLADDIHETAASEPSKEDIKVERVIIPAAVDSTQQGALNLLRSLKIFEDDVKADELCTRREYARWLVQINSSLEGNPKRRIVPTSSLSDSTIPAFDDVGVEDPDFKYIQALAEAGVIPSKLSVDESSHRSESQGMILFFPEKFISRLDLINWRVQLEYDFVPGIEEQSRYQGQKLDSWM